MNLDELWDVTYKEGRRIAMLVKAGDISRADVEAAQRAYPDDAEPIIALFLLDGGTYTTAKERYYP